MNDLKASYCGFEELHSKKNVITEVQTILLKIKNIAHNAFENAPITNRNFFILKEIYEAEKRDKDISPGDISNIFCITRSAVSQFISNLESDGYVFRKFGQQDKRKTYLCLTQKAKELITDIDNTLETCLLKTVESFGEDKFDLLIKLSNEATDTFEKIFIENLNNINQEEI